MRGLSLVTAIKLALPQTPSAKSDGGFLAVLADASTEEISANNATSFVPNSATRQETASLIDMQHQAQPQAAPSAPAQGEPTAHATNAGQATDAARATDAAYLSDKDVVASDASGKAPEKRSASAQEENPTPASAATKSSPAISAPLPQVAPVAIIPNIPAQRFVSQLSQDASATQRPAEPMRQSYAASASTVAANGSAEKANVSNGMQTAPYAAQPKITIAQTLRNMPLDAAIPGNAIPFTFPAQKPATRVPQNASGILQPITPIKQPVAASASVVAVNRAENKATVASGNQSVANATQPKAKIVQASLDVSPAIATPGNVILSNIPAQQPATQSQDASTSQQPITPMKQSDTAPASAFMMNLVPVEPVLSNGTQAAGSVPQPQTSIAQASSDIPPVGTLASDAAATNLPAQQPVAQLSQVAPAAEHPATPTKQPDNTPATVTAGNEASGEAAASNGTQTAYGPSQPETTIPQAFLDLFPSITVSANAIPTNLEGAANGSAAGSQPVSRVTAKQTFDASGTINPNSTDSSNAAANKTAPAASSSHDTPSHDGQSSQNAQSGDASQSAQPLVRAADSSPSQMQAQAIVPSVPSHETASPAPHLPGTLADTSRPTDPQDLPATHSEVGVVATTPEIRSATLVNALNGTEMRVGMQSGEFGDISIRTTMSPQLLHTQISLDHGELSQVISNHVSAAQAKLGDELGLRASIEINHSGSSLQGSAGQSSQRQQNNPSGSGQTIRVANPAVVEKGLSVEMPAVLANGRQLDIRI